MPPQDYIKILVLYLTLLYKTFNSRGLSFAGRRPQRPRPPRDSLRLSRGGRYENAVKTKRSSVTGRPFLYSIQ